jgi:hypothetical protein
MKKATNADLGEPLAKLLKARENRYSGEPRIGSGAGAGIQPF